MSKKKEQEESKEVVQLTDAEKVAFYEQSGIVGLYFALNRKLNELAKALNETQIDLANDDKVFERFMKIAVENRDTVDNLLFLEGKIKEIYKTDDVESTKSNATPILEQFVKNKNESKGK